MSVSVGRIEGLAGSCQGYPEIADELLRVAARARELGMPGGRYSGDQRALGAARVAFLSLKREFLHQPHTPDLVQRYWEGRWNYLGRRVGLKLEVPDHGYFQDEIDGLEHMAVPRKLAYEPDQLDKTPEGLILLSKMHPKMRGWIDKPDLSLSRITSGATGGGWFHIESDWRTPCTNTTQEGLENVLKGMAEDNNSYAWRGQRLTLYIIGSQDSKVLTGHHFDEDGWVRLLGSFFDGKVLRACFDPHGKLYFLWYRDPQLQSSDLGGRFEGAKP